MADHKKTIFEYDNYRLYLKEACEARRRENRGFSFRQFAKIAGFKACNVLNRVIDGERNLAPESIDKFIKALKLARDEASYFRSLVMLNQAKDAEEKAKHAEEIVKSRGYRKIFPLKESQFNFCTQWYFVVIWESVGLPGFHEDPQWIAKKLSPAITPAEAALALDELTQLGLLKRDEHGKLVKTTQNVGTLDEVTSASVAKWHKDMMARAGESISRVPREERDISSVTFAISTKMAKKIKEKIQQFRKEIVEMQKLDEQGGDAVYQFNLQLFPHVQIKEDEKK